MIFQDLIQDTREQQNRNSTMFLPHEYFRPTSHSLPGENKGCWFLLCHHEKYHHCKRTEKYQCNEKYYFYPEITYLHSQSVKLQICLKISFLCKVKAKTLEYLTHASDFKKVSDWGNLFLWLLVIWHLENETWVCDWCEPKETWKQKNKTLIH